MKILIYVLLGVVIVVVGIVTVAAIVGAQFRAQARQGVEVEVKGVERGDLTETITAPGVIDARVSVTISARVSARITEMPFEEGQHVKAGDVLVKLDASELEASLRSREANYEAQAVQLEVDRQHLDAQRSDLKATEATLTQARHDWERQRTLEGTGDVSKADLEKALRTYEELDARRDSAAVSLAAAQRSLVGSEYRLKAAKEDINQARENLSYTVIRSPIEGVVTRINTKVGELTVMGTMNNPGTAILQVADLSQMVMVAQVDEADVAKVKVGQEAIVRLVAFEDEKFKGTVTSLSLATTSFNAQSGNRSRSSSPSFETRILLEPTDKPIRTGLSADAEIAVQKQRNILKVLSQAVVSRKPEDLPESVRKDNPAIDANQTLVGVVFRCVDGKAIATPVRSGSSDLTHTIIKAGLNDGDRVIVGPYKEMERLKHDQNVTEKKASAATSQAAQTRPIYNGPATAPTSQSATEPASIPQR